MEEPQEVQAHETYCASRGPKQPGVLVEPAAQQEMEREVCPRSVAPVVTLNALGSEDAPDAPLLSFLMQRSLLSREEEAEEQEIVAQEYEELYSRRLTLYFFDTGAAEWTERPERSEAAQGALRGAR